ncbi:MAG TPA: hypothetical protein VLF63_00535 [Patescibacteria group bacterium]|nr:hypothetical protein [Patescibacteria group bacterium]
MKLYLIFKKYIAFPLLLLFILVTTIITNSIYHCAYKHDQQYCLNYQQTHNVGTEQVLTNDAQTQNTQQSQLTSQSNSTSGSNNQTSSTSSVHPPPLPAPVVITPPPAVSLTPKPDPFGYKCETYQVPDSSFTKQICGYPGQPPLQVCKQIYYMDGPTGLYECHN